MLSHKYYQSFIFPHLFRNNYNYIHMFRGIFDSIASKISNLNPIKQFIKYALDKTLNEFLKKELTLEDFKNGPLNLQNIQINTQKINKSYLVSSPYIMHYGIIGNLKITLPPLSQLSTQSIQINFSEIQVTLKPNKKFQQNFKEKIIQLHEMNMQKFDVEQKQVQGEISETGPVDFFKELLKKIIMNIKVKISSIAIKLYMNTPSQDKKSPQFYLMLKVPLIYLDKKQDKQLKKNQTEQINFNILTPQISVHLLSEDMKFPDYSNLNCKPEDFPINYPTANHPKTILLIGSSSVPEDILAKIPEWKKDGSINNKGFTQIGFKLTTDYKKKTKQISLHLKVSNIEVMVTPVQIKILSRFVAQIIEFKKILQSILNQLKFEGGQQSMCLKRKISKNSGNTDLFSSIIMNFNNDISSIQHNRESSDLFKSMVKQDRALRQSRRQFNLQFQKQMKSQMREVPSGTQTIQFQAIQFKESVRVDVQFTSICLYVLKYQTNQEYLRVWKENISQQIINKNIGCDYFMFVIKKIDLKMKIKEKDTAVNVKSLHLYHVKLHQMKEQSSFDSFYDVGSSFDFESSRRMSRKSVQQKLNEIHKFKISEKSHFCVEQIIAISQNESQLKFQQQNIKKYSLMPKLHYTNEDAYVLYKPAISVHLDNKQKYFKINLQVFTVSVNLQLILDFLNIAFPLLAYRRLAQMINFKRNQIINKNSEIQSENKGSSSKKNIFQSMYQYQVDLQPIQQLQSQNKNVLIIQIAQAKVGFRKGQVCHVDEKGAKNSNFGDLVKKDKQKIYEQESFSKICFCSINDSGIYLQLQSLKVQKQLSAIKTSCKIIDIGIMKVNKSEIVSLSSILSIKATKTQDSIRVLKQTTHCQSLILSIPELNARFTQDDIVNIVSLAADSIKIVSNIIIYKDYLEREMMMLQKKSSELIKKQRKNQGASEKQIKLYIQKVFVELDYCNFLFQQIVLCMNQQAQQSFICKISKIVGSINRQTVPKVKLCQFVNDEMASKQYLLESSHKQKKMLDSNIFIQIWDQQRPILPFKVEQRHAFFEKLKKQNFSLTFKMIKKQTDRHETNFKKKQNEGKNKLKWSNNSLGSNGTLSQKFKFKQFNNAIEQEGQKKIMILNVTKDVRLNLCNALELKKYIQKIQNFSKYLKAKIKQVQQKLKSQTLYLIQRKHSSEIESSTIEIVAKFSSLIIIDIRPDFISNQKERIFSNMRSIVTINLHDDIVVQINNDKNQKQIIVQLSLFYYFLKNTDRQIALNPLIIRQDRHLSQLGFKILFQVNKLHLKLNMYHSNKSLTLGIKSIYGESSIQTLALIQLHLEHLVNHHIKHENGISVSESYDGEVYQMLEYDAEIDPDLEKMDDVLIVGADLQEQLEIEDLTGALQLYQQKLDQKQNEQAILRSRALVFAQFENPQISIQSITLQKICFRISSLNDFDFNKQANQIKRTRNKQQQEADYYVFLLVNLYLVADIGQVTKQQNDKNKQNISSFIKIEKLKVNLSKQKNYGHFSLKFMEEQVSIQTFVIINSQNQICLAFEKNPSRILIKSYCLKMSIGGTTEIYKTLNKAKLISQQIDRSEWKKIYQNKKQKKQNKKELQQMGKQTKIVKKDTKKQIQRILILVPDSEIKITFQYGNFIKIVDEQIITMKQFILNEQTTDKFQIKQKVKKWVKKIIKNNIGSLISGTALSLLMKLFSQLIALNINWISKLFGFFFSNSE